MAASMSVEIGSRGYHRHVGIGLVRIREVARGLHVLILAFGAKTLVALPPVFFPQRRDIDRRQASWSVRT